MAFFRFSFEKIVCFFIFLMNHFFSFQIFVNVLGKTVRSQPTIFGCQQPHFEHSKKKEIIIIYIFLLAQQPTSGPGRLL